MTAAGDTFLADVRSILSLVDHLPREGRRAQRATTLRCLIGAVPHPYIDRILAATMSDLESRGSRVRVGLRATISPRQPSALLAGDIDIGIGHAFPRALREPDVRGIVFHRLFDDRISQALLAVEHPLARADSLSLRDLADVPFLWPSRQFFPRFYDGVMAAFKAAGTRALVTSEHDGLQTLWSLAAQELGWTLGWQSHRDEPPPGLRAIALRDFDMEWGGMIAYRQDESRAPILAAIDAIVSHARAQHPRVRASDAHLRVSDTRQVTIS